MKKLLTLARNKLSNKKQKDMATKKITGCDLVTKEVTKLKKLKLVNNSGQFPKAVRKLIDPNNLGRQRPPLNWDQKAWAKLIKQPLKNRLISASAIMVMEIDVILAEEEK